MKRKSTWIAVGLLAVVAVASAAFADLNNGNTGGNQAIDLDKNRPPQNECICTWNYEPVVCRAADGTRHEFSNLCFAGCAGYAASSCTPVDPDRL